MNSKSARQPAANDLDALLLEHVARYRLTVVEAALRLPRLAGIEQEQIRRSLQGLKRRSLLSTAPLCVGSTYWHLTAASAGKAGLPERQSGPLSESAKIRAYAILHFCCLTGAARHRLNSVELSQYFPELSRPGLPGGYYFDPRGAGQLGLIRVDAGNNGRWDRVVESLREDVSNHMLQPGFRSLIQAHRFQIAVLTVFPHKARRIQETLAKHADSARIPVEVVSIPELLPLLTSTIRKEVFQPSI
jgi:hypothetical protein